MSSILKALKRLEQQKAVRRDLDHDLAWINRDSGALPREKRRWPTVAALVAVAGVSVLSTYWFTGRGGSRPHPPSPATEDITRPTAESRTAPPATPAITVPQGAVTQPITPTGPGSGASSPAAGKPSSAPPRGVSEIPADGDAPDVAAVPVREEAPATPRQTATPRPAESALPRPAASSGLPRLNVTGIAWQNDSPVHFAVVNGQSVSEGSTVEGARVEKIFPDRVSFSFRNRTFEVQLAE